MIERLEKGLAFSVTDPVYGKQDRGITPGGPMDMFSYETGNGLLGNEKGHPALEIIVPPVIRFLEDAWFVVVGAAWTGLSLMSEQTRQSLNHAQVYRASAGDILGFGEKKYGFRSYLCYKAVGAETGQGPCGKRRCDFDSFASWPDKQGFIRIMEGPEYTWLKNPDDFFSQSFKIGNDSNTMGLRLVPTVKSLDLSEKRDMISEAVADGTVQLTATGLVVLLRHRQTVGGYPRVFNVITADLDVLGQMEPFQLVRFKRVTLADALDVMNKRNNDLTRYDV